METQLRPGDIINVSAPGNDALDGQDFIISFIGPDRLTINSESGTRTQIEINDRGELVDKTIRQIELLSREAEESFARQNNLVPGEYIAIKLSDGSSVSGKIVGLEEDQIAVNLKDGDDIFIDFAYRGLDDRLGIESIDVVPPPGSAPADDERPATEDEGEEDEVTLLSGRDVVFGPKLEEISMLVEVPENEKKYGLERQQNDLLDELLTTIPTEQRTAQTMADIHNMVESFSILRRRFSQMDSSNAIVGPAVGVDKTLAEKLLTADGDLRWIVPIVTNTKKLYPGTQDDTASSFFEGIVVRTQAELMEELGNTMDIYERGTSLDADNAFAAMMRSVSSIWQPFLSDRKEAFPIASSISTVVGNQPDQMSTVFSENTIGSRRFFTERYITGDTVLETTKLKGGDSKTVRKQIVENERISIDSFIVLPVPVIQHSNLFCRNTDILTKADLSCTPFSLWRLLHTQSIVQPSYVSETNGSKLSLSHKTTQSYAPEGGESFAEFVDTFTPSPAGMFAEYSEPGYSVFSCITNLAPFLLDTANVDTDATALMAVAVKEMIGLWTAKRAQHILSYKKALSTKHAYPTVYRWSRLGINPTVVQFLEQSYGSERTALDNGRLLTATLAVDSSHLVTPKEPKQSPDQEPASTGTKTNSCAAGVLAKLYSSRESMLADLARPLKFDEGLDKTYYDTLGEYTTMLDRATTFDGKRKTLQEQLVQRTGMRSVQARREAEALLLGYRIVEEGDYALVADDQVYQWSGIAWEPTVGLSKSDILGKATIACNMQDSCLEFNGKCTPLDALQNALLSTDDVIGIFAATDKELKVRKDVAQTRLPALRALHSWKQGTRERMMRSLGATAVVVDTPISPYSYVLDLILEQADFAIRQRHIVQFAASYTRPPLPGDADAWLYCISSGAQLLPVFLQELAAAYVRGDDYADTLDRIVSERGTLGGDGEAVVDKNTGWVITNIDMSTEEGFTDQGFIIKTREVLKQDPTDLQPPRQYTDKQSQIVSIVMAALADFTGINTSTFETAVISNVTLLLDTTMPTKAEYDTAVSKLKSKKDSYDKAFSQTIVLYTASYFLLYVQTLPYVPKNTRVFPGCRRTFAGYPAGAATDKSGLEFVACILSKIRSEEKPWNAVNRLKQSTILKKLNKIIDRYILNTELANQLILSKTDGTAPSVASVPDARYRWLNFLPPPDPTSLGILADLNPAKDELLISLRRGTAEQFAIISGIRTEQMRAAIEIEVSIQHALETDLARSSHMLTTSAGVPYLENACCSTESADTNAFFAALETSIPKTCAFADQRSPYLGHRRPPRSS